MLHKHFVVVVLLLLATLIGGQAGAQTGTTVDTAGTLVHDGLTRDYLLHVPAELQTLAPLVIALHGGGGTAAGFRSETDFDSVADANSFIVVYPQGVNREWNERRGSGMTVRRSDADDVGFIAALIDYLSAAYPVDPARVYAMGISNGGFMSLRLACDLRDRLAGIGVVAAQLTADMRAECIPSRPLRVAILNGTDDPIVPYDGGAVQVSGQFRGEVLPTDGTVAFWLEANTCDRTPDATETIDDRPLDGTSIELTRYESCAPGGAVRLYRVVGGGHALPGGSQYLPRAVIGTLSRELHTPTELWAFWSAE
ncbi:MAG: esterase [Chloroflexi bacterium]|nr:esterase [Chloroflexota bacterium]